MQLYLDIAPYDERSQKRMGGGGLGNGCSDVILKIDCFEETMLGNSLKWVSGSSSSLGTDFGGKNWAKK